MRASYNANTVIVDPVRADAAYYLIYANNLLDFATFSKDRTIPPIPDSYWAPGYPLFLALVIKAADILKLDGYSTILNAQLLLGVATVLLTFLVGVSFLPGYWALLPAFFAAISPHLVSTASYIVAETVLGFVLLCSLYALSSALVTQRRFHWLLAGAGFALSYLVNPVTLFLAPLLAIALWLHNRSSGVPKERSPTRPWALVVLVSPLILTAALWSTRSAIVVPPDQPGAADRLLANLTVGLYPDYHEKWRDSILKPQANIIVPGAGVDESYTTFFTELKQRFANDPLPMLGWYTVQKPIALWGWDIKTGWGGIYIYRIAVSLYETSVPAIATYSLMYGLHPWLLAASILGLGFVFGGPEKSVMPLILYICVFYVSSIYVITQAEARYSIPLRAEFYLCASFFLWQLVQWLARLRQASLQASSK